MKKQFSTIEARSIAAKLGAKLNKHGLNQFKQGLKVELEHGKEATEEGINGNVTNDDPIKTGKIALAHINEHPEYYTGLSKMEGQQKEKDETKKSLKSIIIKNTKK